MCVDRKIDEENEILEDLNVIYILHGEWDSDHRRPQMEAMAVFCNLTCIEAPLTLNTVIKIPRAFSKWLENGWKPRHLGKNLQIFKPLALVSYSIDERFSVLRIINRSILSSFIRHNIQSHKKDSCVLMLAHPMQRHFIGLFDTKLLCYEVTDAYDKVQRGINIAQTLSWNSITQEIIRELTGLVGKVPR